MGTIKDILAQELPKGHTFESLQANLDKRRIELTKNSRGYIYRIKRTDVEIVHFTNASKNPLNTRTELKLNQPESDRFFRVDHQKAKALNNAKQKIAKLVNEATKDNPDYFLFAQRLKQSNLIARLYRTKGRKRKGRYKLKYQIVKSIEFQSHSSLGGTLAKLIAEGKVKFDPEIHYQKEIPPEIVRQVQLEIEQAEKLKQNSNPTKQTIPTKIVESPPSSNIRPKTKKQKSDEMEL